MRFRALFCVLAVSLAGWRTGRQASEPPRRYERDAEAAVRFLAPDKAAEACAGTAHELGVHVEACNRDARVILPNPCEWPGSDPYADQACHELGHWNGWPASHPRR
jgi:hypothetical protein